MQEDLYINLIYKKLSGEISTEESTKLDLWLAAAKENRETLANVSAAWEVSGDLKPKVELDLDQEFSLLESRMEAEENPVQKTPVIPIQSKPKSSQAMIWRIAAGILFLIAGFFLVKNVSQPKEVFVDVITTDEIKQVSLPDGTVISLNKNSSITYDKMFSGTQRLVSLKGEALFDVRHDEERPFIVKFDNQAVEVLGTSFNIETNAEQTTVALISGKVKWMDNSVKKSIEMSPGMTVTKNLISGVVELKKDSGFNFDYWQDQNIKFDETPLKNVLKDLERIFNVKFAEIPANLNNCRFSSNFEKATLESILETISTVFRVEFTLAGANKYQLKGGECQ